MIRECRYSAHVLFHFEKKKRKNEKIVVSNEIVMWKTYVAWLRILYLAGSALNTTCERILLSEEQTKGKSNSIGGAYEWFGWFIIH